MADLDPVACNSAWAGHLNDRGAHATAKLAADAAAAHADAKARAQADPPAGPDISADTSGAGA